MKRAQSILNQIPYAKSMHIECDDSEQGLLFKLPALTQNMSMPISAALHQGALLGFMQTSAITQLMLTDGGFTQSKVIGLSIDYIQSGTYRDTYAHCKTIQQQDSDRYVCVTAWQSDALNPIALAYIYF